MLGILLMNKMTTARGTDPFVWRFVKSERKLLHEVPMEVSLCDEPVCACRRMFDGLGGGTQPDAAGGKRI
jgi:hypothetical protein